jgi:DNA polymerase/3'-5' exonuclease PolX
MQHAQALVLAKAALNALAPYCDRICIAGSIRRMKSECKDIELVAIPRMVPGGLFGDELEVDPGFCEVVNRWAKVKGEPTGKYTQRVLPGSMVLDLFITMPDNWGWILALRTGSAGFNEHVLLRTLKQRGYSAEHGHIQRAGQIVPIPEETDLFARLKLPWVEPWAREV